MSHSGDPRCAAPGTVREVSDDVGTRGLEAIFHVAVGPGPLLEILWDVQNFARLFPDIHETKIVGGDPSTPAEWLDVAYRVNVVIKEIGYVLRRRVDRETCCITWQELSGDLRRVRGGWWLAETSAPTVTLATYRAFVDVGRFVPTRLVARGARRKADEMIERVRRVAAELHAGRG